jgi:competence protein ComEC
LVYARALRALEVVAGVWWLQQQAALPATHWAWGLAAGGLAATFARPGTAALRIARGIAVSAACFAFGFGWASWCAQQRLADALPVEWEGRDIAVVGVVAGLPQAHERGVRFDFDVERRRGRACRRTSCCRGGAARRGKTGRPRFPISARASGGS